MALCKICGKAERTKPRDWINWDCPKCAAEEIRGTDGTLSPVEKKAHNVGRNRNIKGPY